MCEQSMRQKEPGTLNTDVSPLPTPMDVVFTTYQSN